MSSLTPQADAMYLDTHLALSQIGDTDAMNSMLGMLQEALARDLPRIEQFLQAGEVASANRLLHALKGFIPIFCRPELCAHVVRVEAQSKDSQSTTAGPAYGVLKPELEALLSEVGAYLQAHVS